MTPLLYLFRTKTIYEPYMDRKKIFKPQVQALNQMREMERNKKCVNLVPSALYDIVVDEWPGAS